MRERKCLGRSGIARERKRLGRPGIARERKRLGLRCPGIVRERKRLEVGVARGWGLRTGIAPQQRQRQHRSAHVEHGGVRDRDQDVRVTRLLTTRNPGSAHFPTGGPARMSLTRGVRGEHKRSAPANGAYVVGGSPRSAMFVTHAALLSGFFAPGYTTEPAAR